MEDLRYICAWCKKKIKKTDSLYPLMGISPSRFEIEESYEGEWVKLEFKTIDKVIYCFYLPKDSPMKKEGYDNCCVVCSEECSKLLDTAIKNEISKLSL